MLFMSYMHHLCYYLWKFHYLIVTFISVLQFVQGLFHNCYKNKCYKWYNAPGDAFFYSQKITVPEGRLYKQTYLL